MLSQTALQLLLREAAQKHPERTALIEPGVGQYSYAQLDKMSDKVRDRLVRLGVLPGDRVGIYLRKSIDSVIAIFGVLKAGAAYVPVDPYAPPARDAYILQDCSVRAVVVEEQFAPGLLDEFDQPAFSPAILALDGVGGGQAMLAALDKADAADPAPAVESHTNEPQDLAYILYTSGSTGKPKGVKLSHRAAISYVDWCTATFNPQAEDRFSSHAPFHFDLSILDLYVPIKHGAAIVLIGEELGKEPQSLAAVIAEERITSWYSTPSILTFLSQYGKLDRFDYADLRTVLFAGEVFPIKHLRKIKEQIEHPKYFNLYGPTETNVCTYYEIPDRIPADRSQPYPIGWTCSHVSTQVVDEEGNLVAPGEEGELVVYGAGVMDGYWNLPARTAEAFLVDSDGKRWYKTGDIVIEDPSDGYIFLGRRDRMVKKRGYRIELGEIEAGLYRHPAVEEAAVIALTDNGNGVQIKAFLSCRNDERPSIIELKQFCNANLPSYMTPDMFSFQPVLPKTSTDKIDYQKLKTIH